MHEGCKCCTHWKASESSLTQETQTVPPESISIKQYCFQATTSIPANTSTTMYPYSHDELRATLVAASGLWVPSFRLPARRISPGAGAKCPHSHHPRPPGHPRPPWAGRRQSRLPDTAACAHHWAAARVHEAPLKTGVPPQPAGRKLEHSFPQSVRRTPKSIHSAKAQHNALHALFLKVCIQIYSACKSWGCDAMSPPSPPPGPKACQKGSLLLGFPPWLRQSRWRIQPSHRHLHSSGGALDISGKAGMHMQHGESFTCRYAFRRPAYSAKSASGTFPADSGVRGSAASSRLKGQSSWSPVFCSASTIGSCTAS